MSRPASKSLRSTAISQEAHTNANGYYRLPGLAVGRYSIAVSSDRFKMQIINDLKLQIGQTRTLNVALAVGGTDEKGEVNAVLTPAEMTSPAASTVIDTEQIEELPNNGRDWASFTLLAPFAQDDGAETSARFAWPADDA